MSKTYLFAGASSAIAEACAKNLQKKGHHLIGLSTKDATTIYDEFHTVESYQTGNFPSIERTIDGLVYFPGTINLKPFNRITEADLLNDFQINNLGAVAFIQSYLKNIKMSQSASVVLMSSVAGSVGLPFHASIAMAKGGIESFTRALAAELAPSIRVNCVAPSLTNTPLGEKLLNTPEKMELMKKRNPLQKVGSPEEVGNVISFLLSEESAWISGQILAVDGGMNSLKI
jgi:3-oxoacyl-[acyl-carrier protein] reductase